jgi:hypothetical protein
MFEAPGICYTESIDFKNRPLQSKSASNIVCAEKTMFDATESVFKEILGRNTGFLK